MSSRFVGQRRLVPVTLRGHLTRTGDAKVKYSKAEAQAAAVRHHKSAYRCDVCDQWHIGGRTA